MRFVINTNITSNLQKQTNPYKIVLNTIHQVHAV